MSIANPEPLIRKAERADAPALIRLIVALAEYESLTPPDAGAQARFIADGFGERPRFESWLVFPPAAGEAVGPVGYAILIEMYSSFLARPTLYLEDLFVLPEVRGRGWGTALLRHCVHLAYERGCGRMEWTCLDWNCKAQQFYERIGAEHLKEWLLYRLTRDQMKEFLGREGVPLAIPETGENGRQLKK